MADAGRARKTEGHRIVGAYPVPGLGLALPFNLWRASRAPQPDAVDGALAARLARLVHGMRVQDHLRFVEDPVRERCARSARARERDVAAGKLQRRVGVDLHLIGEPRDPALGVDDTHLHAAAEM